MWATPISKALASERPAVDEVMVIRDWPYTGAPAVGWWDVPIPGHMTGRADYEKAIGEEDV